MVDAVRQIGAATPVFSRTITRESLLAYQRALSLRGAIHADPQAAVARGYRDLVAPPGYVIAFTVIPRDVKLGTFAVDERRALAGGMGFEIHSQVCAGDTLTGCCVLADIRRKEGDRPMTILSFETRLTNQLGELALVVTDTTMEIG